MSDLEGGTAIDLDRGVSRRRVGRDGPFVSEYKDQPGVFYDDSGEEVEDETATAAGFDVQQRRLEGAWKRRVGDQLAQLEREQLKIKTEAERQAARERAQLLDKDRQRAIAEENEARRREAEAEVERRLKAEAVEPAEPPLRTIVAEPVVKDARGKPVANPARDPAPGKARLKRGFARTANVVMPGGGLYFEKYVPREQAEAKLAEILAAEYGQES